MNDITKIPASNLPKKMNTVIAATVPNNNDKINNVKCIKINNNNLINNNTLIAKQVVVLNIVFY